MNCPIRQLQLHSIFCRLRPTPCTLSLPVSNVGFCNGRRRTRQVMDLH
jgi:hypothetical protein